MHKVTMEIQIQFKMSQLLKIMNKREKRSQPELEKITGMKVWMVQNLPKIIKKRMEPTLLIMDIETLVLMANNRQPKKKKWIQILKLMRKFLWNMIDF